MPGTVTGSGASAVNGTDNLPAWGRMGVITKYISFSVRLPKFESQLRPYGGMAELSVRHLRWGPDHPDIAAPPPKRASGPGS